MSSLRVCLADIEKESSSPKRRAVLGERPRPKLYKPTWRKLTERATDAPNYNLRAEREASPTGTPRALMSAAGPGLITESVVREWGSGVSVESKSRAHFAARRFARAAPTAMLRSAQTNVPTAIMPAHSTNIFCRSSGLTSPMYGAMKMKSRPASSP